jgi:resuscitation-promoting factor RpfB
MSTSPTPPTRHRDAPGHDPSRHWGTSPTPPGPKPKHRGRILLAAPIGLILLVAIGCAANGSPTDNGPAPTPTTIPSPNPPTTPSPDPEPEPEPEPEPFEVPELTGMTRAEAEQTLADIGLKATTRYRSTDQESAETVISQSPKAGAWVLPDATVRLMVAKTPPPPPSTAPPPPPTAPEQGCDPSYPDVCLDPAVEDYDCAGGTGNGPEYVEGPIRVLPPDPFDLDREGDGVGCESG